MQADTSEGPQTLYNALNNHVYDAIGPERYLDRIKKMLNVLLTAYHNKFDWQPRTIVFSGGRVSFLQEHFNFIQSKFSNHIIFIPSDIEQIKMTLYGNIIYHEKQSYFREYKVN